MSANNVTHYKKLSNTIATEGGPRKFKLAPSPSDFKFLSFDYPMAPNQNPDREDPHLSVDDSPVDLGDLIGRLYRGAPQILALALIGAAIGALAYLPLNPTTQMSTSMRVVFSFAGMEKGEYPDHSRFQPDDLRSPDIIQKALKQQGLDSSDDSQSKIRGAISIEGVIPENLIKERDRIRASGQTPAAYIPDEYIVSLTLPRKFPLSSTQRELLLNEIVSTYLHNFQETYADLPQNFANSFETMRNADYYEYELVVTQDVQNMISYLEQQEARAPRFRSRTTHMSFSDLRRETELFAQIHLNETLGIIYTYGLSSNRDTAMMKMDYYLRTLADEENSALEQEAVIKNLLTQSMSRTQDYVLGIKSQAGETHNQATVLDQGLIDSLLANDAYNFLVHRALEAGLKVKAIQAEKSRLEERRQRMESFLKSGVEDQAAIIAKVRDSLVVLKAAYADITENVRATSADFARQQYGNAVTLGSMVNSSGIARPFATFCIVGAFLGTLGGLGTALLGIYFAPLKKHAAQ